MRGPYARVSIHHHFEKQLARLEEPDQARVRTRVGLFVMDPFNPVLRNHALEGDFDGRRSIDIENDLRALYREEGEEAIFVAVGTHARLYG